MINIFNEQQAGVGNWAVWTDPDGCEKVGRHIGRGRTKQAAIENAIEELTEDLRQLKKELPE